ncbi:cytochrome bd-II oxidase subunit CbdX [Escherichia coli]|nr:cytochrome bd-II oxidase subunit CbdX [Escherichia coli]QBO92039.1 cytochrome bd-II oxidase subunit CbdX [Escherichia coli]QBO96719.1 cytochrome bd-II oxidase subunit CbdX [Escherichia coli]
MWYLLWFVGILLMCSLSTLVLVDWPPESPDNQYHLNK